MFNHVGVPEILLVVAVVAVIGVVFKILPYWFIFRKAGFHPALSLLMIVPIASLVMLYIFAFSNWPSLKKPPASTG